MLLPEILGLILVQRYIKFFFQFSFKFLSCDPFGGKTLHNSERKDITHD